jgi:hypothetical protein
VESDQKSKALLEELKIAMGGLNGKVDKEKETLEKEKEHLAQERRNLKD